MLKSNENLWRDILMFENFGDIYYLLFYYSGDALDAIFERVSDIWADSKNRDELIFRCADACITMEECYYFSFHCPEEYQLVNFKKWLCLGREALINSKVKVEDLVEICPLSFHTKRFKKEFANCDGEISKRAWFFFFIGSVKE